MGFLNGVGKKLKMVWGKFEKGVKMVWGKLEMVWRKYVWGKIKTTDEKIENPQMKN